MDALADQIAAAMSTAGVDVQVYARIPPNPSLPAIDLFPGEPAFDTETAAFADIYGGDFLTVRARVDNNDHEANQDIIVDFMDRYSDMSVAAAIMDDPTLGGLANLDVRSGTGLRAYSGADGATIAFGAEWTVLVLRIES